MEKNGLQALARGFFAAGARLYGVGGMVRNPLLGLPVSDLDVTSALEPEKVMALCQEKGWKWVPKGVDFGMVEIHGAGVVCEHTTFRADTYGPGGGHRPRAVSFSTSLEADAFRRDFTVNALYQDLLTGEIFDPTGGLQDLKAGVLRATSPDPALIMGEDALRVLRLARFAGELGFQIHPETGAAAARFAGGLQDISGERVRDELSRILLGDVKYGKAGAVYRGLSLLEGLGGLDVILPELARGRGIRQRAEFHAYDVLSHCLHAAGEAEAAGGLPLRLGALLHDVGKPIALEKNGRMLGHDKLGAPVARDILGRLRFPRAVAEEVVFLVENHMFDLNGQAKESTLRRRFAQWGPERTEQLIRLRRADIRGSGRGSSEKTADRWARVLGEMRAQAVPFTQEELAIDGRDLMEALGRAPGPWLGALKEALHQHCIQHPQDNRRDKLLRLAEKLME